MKRSRLTLRSENHQQLSHVGQSGFPFNDRRNSQLKKTGASELDEGGYIYYLLWAALLSF